MRQRSSSHHALLALFVIGVGFALRLLAASTTYLNPDEAFHYFLANQNSLFDAYHASLNSAHPPLLILVTYVWQKMGNTELLLRLPSVLAGTLSCWCGYKWLERITNSKTALAGVILLALSPALFRIEAELRQYSLLLLFITATLYFLERAFREDSSTTMALASLTLWLAIAVHYSGLLFAAVIFVYGLVHFLRARADKTLLIVFAVGQVCAFAEGVFFFQTHIARIRGSAAMQTVAETWLSKSIYHPGGHPVWFVLINTYRLFDYVLAQPVAGSLLLLLYVAGIVGLLRTERVGDSDSADRELAMLLALPLVINAAAALAGVYPFGGTRHSLFLTPFVIAGAVIGLGRLDFSKRITASAMAGALILLCSIFPAPYGAYITVSNQSQKRMAAAVVQVRQSVPGNSVVLIDQQTEYPFRYYFCRDQVVAGTAVMSRCGSYRLWHSGPLSWMFTPAEFDSDVRAATTAYSLKPGDTILVFQTGWSVDKEPEMRRKLRQSGCKIWPDLGQNVVVCTLAVK